MDDVSEVRDLDPAAENLEGYLFPATYSFPTGTKASAIVDSMAKRFHQSWTPERAAKARALNMAKELCDEVEKTPRRVVSTSLIERANKLLAVIQFVRGPRH